MLYSHRAEHPHRAIQMGNLCHDPPVAEPASEVRGS